MGRSDEFNAGRVPVQEMHPEEFAKRFKPAYYSDTWDNVAKHPTFEESDHGPVDMDELVDSVARHGIRNPVQVNSFDEVDEGHHRVVAARAAGVPVRFQHWNK